MGFDPRPLVRKLGRPNARPLERDEASALFDAMLDGTLDDVQLGAAWMGLRIKGETPDELTAFLESAERSYSHWEIGTAPAGTLPVVIPSYNGARQLANLTPLLAMLLARSDINIIVHGVDDDPENAESTDPARGYVWSASPIPIISIGCVPASPPTQPACCCCAAPKGRPSRIRAARCASSILGRKSRQMRRWRLSHSTTSRCRMAPTPPRPPTGSPALSPAAIRSRRQSSRRLTPAFAQPTRWRKPSPDRLARHAHSTCSLGMLS